MFQDVATLENAIATGFNRGQTEMRQILAAECQQGRAVGAFEGRHERGRRLLGVSRPDHVEIRNDPESADGFDWLVSRAVFAHAD